MRGRRLPFFQYLGLAVALTLAALTSTDADWQPTGLVVLLAALTAASHLFPFEAGKVRICGSFMTLALAMALLGPGPAVAFGLAAVLADAARHRPDPGILRLDLLTYAVFPLVGALLFRAVENGLGLTAEDVAFAPVFCVVFLAVNIVNFSLVIVQKPGAKLFEAFRVIYLPVVFWEFAAAGFTAMVAYAYAFHGTAAVAVLATMLLVLQRLLQSVLAAEKHGKELAERLEELAHMHEGMLFVMLKTLSLRDPMTARHSAAVARYSREIAKAAGLPEEDQKVVHTAALLHDIGKFNFPDSILTGRHKLSDEEFEIIRRHPGQGAGIIRRVPGFEQVARVVECHHERIDGKGYPNGLAGDDIPVLSRIISVADTYDVMTARDSYRDPVSAQAALEELRRVSGAQLDAHMVEIFTGLLEEQALAFRHQDYQDLDAELSVERGLRAGLSNPAVA